MDNNKPRATLKCSTETRDLLKIRAANLRIPLEELVEEVLTAYLAAIDSRL